MPYTLGRDGAGVIEQILEDGSNPEVHDLKVGDRVAYGPLGSGSYAEYTVVPIKNVVKVPSFLQDLDLACAAMVQGLTGKDSCT